MSIDEIKEHEYKLIAQHGFIIHAVMSPFDQTANIHTHGLVTTFDHPDFQCVVPLPPETINGIFHNLVNEIRGGRKFKAGEIVSKILEKFKVTFVWATEGNRDVLRIILPDNKGNLAPDKLTGKLALQYQGQMLQ